MEIKKVVRINNSNDWFITIRRRFLFWAWETTYRGHCTVWHEYPSGLRASTLMEVDLSDIWQQQMWLDEERIRERRKD